MKYLKERVYFRNKKLRTSKQHFTDREAETRKNLTVVNKLKFYGRDRYTTVV